MPGGMGACSASFYHSITLRGFNLPHPGCETSCLKERTMWGGAIVFNSLAMMRPTVPGCARMRRRGRTLPSPRRSGCAARGADLSGSGGGDLLRAGGGGRPGRGDVTGPALELGSLQFELAALPNALCDPRDGEDGEGDRPAQGGADESATVCLIFDREPEMEAKGNCKTEH